VCKSGTVLWYPLCLWFQLAVELLSGLMLVEFSAIGIEKYHHHHVPEGLGFSLFL
jgi:hypothetical protein